jgi:hypothetical protein
MMEVHCYVIESNAFDYSMPVTRFIPKDQRKKPRIAKTSPGTFASRDIMERVHRKQFLPEEDH